MKRKASLILLIPAMFLLMADDGCQDSSDQQQHDQQEQMLKEATAQTGMPAIKNFRERKMLKEILELRDQNGLITYTYLYNEMTGKLVFFCNSVGYGIPYATEYTNPQKRINGAVVLPQADPNGLFAPNSAEGTWVLCKDPHGDTTKPVYIEPRIVSSPFKLEEK